MDGIKLSGIVFLAALSTAISVWKWEEIKPDFLRESYAPKAEIVALEPVPEKPSLENLVSEKEKQFLDAERPVRKTIEINSVTAPPKIQVGHEFNFQADVDISGLRGTPLTERVVAYYEGGEKVLYQGERTFTEFENDVHLSLPIEDSFPLGKVVLEYSLAEGQSKPQTAVLETEARRDLLLSLRFDREIHLSEYAREHNPPGTRMINLSQYSHLIPFSQDGIIRLSDKITKLTPRIAMGITPEEGKSPSLKGTSVFYGPRDEVVSSLDLTFEAKGEEQGYLADVYTHEITFDEDSPIGEYTLKVDIEDKERGVSEHKEIKFVRLGYRVHDFRFCGEKDFQNGECTTSQTSFPKDAAKIYLSYRLESSPPGSSSVAYNLECCDGRNESGMENPEQIIKTEDDQLVSREIKFSNQIAAPCRYTITLSTDSSADQVTEEFKVDNPVWRWCGEQLTQR